MKIDDLTKSWIRNKSDEKAAANGCVFDLERACYAVWWIERCCVLYEGEDAGNAMKLRSLHDTDIDSACFTEDENGFLRCKFDVWNDRARRVYFRRASIYAREVTKGAAIDWQFECIMRMYGWIRYSEHWSNRNGQEEWIRRFNHAVIIIPKKNKKSPTLAANALYCAIGDGEQGAKSFFFAKDGTQAKQIAGQHAIEMVKASPVLLQECKIDHTTYKITHLPTRSIIQPASSGDARHQKSKEGINGSTFIDEIHVVDRSAMNRINRAGISRKEPLQLEVSTAGNDPDGYGYGRYEYTKDVIDGKIEDQRLFGYVAEAPQDLTIETFEKDPKKFMREANPALGHTVNEEEFMADFKTSKHDGQLQILEFFMYRLDVWQKSSAPMINPDQWTAAACDFDVEMLYGQGGGLGLDVAKVNDIAACFFNVEIDTVQYFWPIFWMTRHYVDNHKHLVPDFLKWEKLGHLNVVDGKKLHDSVIEAGIWEVAEHVRPRLIVYDETFAGDIVENLQDKLGGEKHCQTLGLVQSYEKYTEPTTEFLGDLKEGKIRHPNNECMNWQTRNVSLGVRDKKCKPIRDKEKERHRKIDGVQAMIMSHLARRREPEEYRSVYEDRGIIVV